MSYQAGQALQSALYILLTGDSALSDLVGAAIFDAPPPSDAPETYVSLGTETVTTTRDSSGEVVRHAVVIAVVSDAAGFSVAKRAAGRIADLMNEGPISISQGQVVRIQFHKATAKRVGTGGGRRIELTFRAFIDFA